MKQEGTAKKISKDSVKEKSLTLFVSSTKQPAPCLPNRFCLVLSDPQVLTACKKGVLISWRGLPPYNYIFYNRTVR